MTFHYLASPYSHEDPLVREERYLKALQTVDKLKELNIAAYSPIVHFHDYSKIYRTSTDAGFYNFHNLAMIMASSGLIILTPPYWGISVGVTGEINWAKEFKKPIQLMDPKYGMLSSYEKD